MQTLQGSWKDGTPVKLRLVITSCKLAFPNREHCEPCYIRQPDFWGPSQLNMHNLCIKACCHCVHVMNDFTEQQWKDFADFVGLDYSLYDFNAITSVSKITKQGIPIANKAVRAKRCKMCKEEDAEIGKYCEACHSFRMRNGMSL